MWPSFWIAVAIGLVSAIPILKAPNSEGFWTGVGFVANGIQSGTLHALVQPKSLFRNEEQCHEEPVLGPPGTEWTETVCRDVPVYTGYQAPEFDFWAEAGKVISGMFIDTAGAAAAGLILIFLALMFMGKEAAAKKRKEIFW